MRNSSFWRQKVVLKVQNAGPSTTPNGTVVSPFAWDSNSSEAINNAVQQAGAAEYGSERGLGP